MSGDDVDCVCLHMSRVYKPFILFFFFGVDVDVDINAAIGPLLLCGKGGGGCSDRIEIPAPPRSKSNGWNFPERTLTTYTTLHPVFFLLAPLPTPGASPTE